MAHADTLRAAYGAFRTGDVPAMLAALDENIEWYVPTLLPHGGTYRGHAGVLECLGTLAASLADARVDVDAVVESDDRVVVTGRTSGVLSGSRVVYPFAHSWRFVDGRAVSFDEYVDPAALLAVAA